jgi:uncharacterized protein with ATP-grasp and redox domains
MNHALSISRKTGLDEAGQREVLNEVARMLPDFSLEDRPPQMSRRINEMIRGMTGVDDPFYEEKRESNRHALRLMENLEARITEAGEPLLTAIEYAIAGNSIDFGAFHSLDIEKTIAEKVAEEGAHIKNEEPRLFSYERLYNRLASSSTLLYIADNAGELVFDYLLLRQMRRSFPHLEITVALRDRPILNDATVEDARQIGLDDEFHVVSSGSDAPGTILEDCSEDFIERFRRADTVISKGQGNYETLSDAPRDVFLLLRTKCSVVARHTGSREEDILLIEGGQDT